MKLLVGSVALLFAMTASAQPTLGPWTWTDVKLNDATTGDPGGTVTGSFTFVPGPFAATLTGSTTGADGTTFDSGTAGPGGIVLLRSADGPDYTGAPGFLITLLGLVSAVPGGSVFDTTVFDLDATPSEGSADIAFSVSDGTARITGASQVTCINEFCSEGTDVYVVDYDSVPPPTIVGTFPAITNYQYSLNGGPPVALSPDAAVSPITISGLTNGTTYSITLQALDAGGQTVGEASNPVEFITLVPPVPPVPTVATPVPTSPIWLLGMMAGLLSLVAVRKLRKA